MKSLVFCTHHPVCCQYSNPMLFLADPCFGASVDKSSRYPYAASDLAIAIVMSIVLSLTLGFFLGYRASIWRNARAHRSQGPDYPSNLEKTQNMYDAGPTANHHRNDVSPHSEKQLNVVYNPLKSNSGKTPNGNVETTVSPGKSKKVYV